MAFKLRPNGPVSTPDANNVLYKLQDEICPIIVADNLNAAIKEQYGALNSKLTTLPLESTPYHTPKLLMAISGCGWHQTIPSLHLFKLYMGGLHVLRNTDGYVQSEQEKSLHEMERRLFKEFCATPMSTEENATVAQNDFTFKSLRLLEYQILTIMQVDQSKWPNLLCDNTPPAPELVHDLCQEECDKGRRYLSESRKKCVNMNTKTPKLDFHVFLHNVTQTATQVSSSAPLSTS
jgi:hypothetical protein